MSGRDIGFAAAIVCLFALSANTRADETESRPVIIVASPSILPEGSKCRIELKPAEIDESETVFESITFYEGTIKKITKDKVLLTAASIEVRCINNSPLSDIPILNRYFKNTGIARSALEEKEVPIPVDQIRSITLMEAAKPRGPVPSVPRRPEAESPGK